VDPPRRRLAAAAAEALVIASLRGLVVLAAVALVLAVVLVVDVVHTLAPVDRALVPGFSADRVMYLQWREVQVRRDGTGWMLCKDAATGDLSVMACRGWRAEPGAVDALLSALRGARWHRRGEGNVAGAIGRKLVVGLGGPTIDIGLASPVEGTDQRWLVVNKASLLVDGWVARALFPDTEALIDRDVLPGVDAASRIEIGHMHLAIPCRLSGLWVEPVRCDAVVQALAALKVATIVAQPVAPDFEHTVAITTRGGREHHAAVSHDAVCSTGQIAIVADAGTACVSDAAWEAAFAAADAFVGPPQAIVDRRPLPIAPTKVTTPGGTLDLTAMRLDDKDADRDAVTALVAALSAPAEVAPLPAGKPTATFVATDRGGTSVTIDVTGDVLVRRGEPVALKPSHEALATITRPASALLDPTRWVEDPLVVSELVVDGATYRRGAVVGEWTREPAGTVDPVTIEALATALAHVRAPASPSVGQVSHHVIVKLAPPVGTPATHTLDIGAHCAARLDGQPVQLDPGICAALEKIRNRSSAAPH
jgi:hypothetical protein